MYTQKQLSLFDFTLLHKDDFMLEWNMILQNPNITLQNIDELGYEKNDDYFEFISDNSNITMKYVLDNLNENWNWESLSKNPAITIKDIIDNPDKPWDYQSLSENINITIEYVLDNLDEDWDWTSLSMNPNITMNNIEKNINLPWVWTLLSFNKNLYLDFVFQNLDKPWDWSGISRSYNITLDQVLSNINCPWHWDSLTTNHTITPEFINSCGKTNRNIAYRRKFGWCDALLSCNPNVNIKYVKNHPEINWNWNGLSANLNIMKDVISNSGENWSWPYISGNPTLNLNDVQNNLELPWDYERICCNKFKFDNRLKYFHIAKLKEIKRKVKSFTIPNWYELSLLVKKQEFMKWYCGEDDGNGGGIGRKVDHKRIMDFGERIKR